MVSMADFKPRFAPIAPIDILEKMVEADYAGSFHLLLAHDVLEKKEDYNRVCYKIYSKNPKDYFVIMDNSLIELGEPLKPEQLLEACRITNANVLVLPDKLSKGKKTAIMSVEAAFEICSTCFPPVGPPVAFLGVVQGKSEEECIECARVLARIPVSYFSVPRITVKNLGTRKNLIIRLWQEFKKPMHLLGFSDDLNDDINCCRLPGVIGIDSAVPVRLGLDGRIMKQDTEVAKRKPDYLAKGKTYCPTVEGNVRWMKGLVER